MIDGFAQIGWITAALVVVLLGVVIYRCRSKIPNSETQAYTETMDEEYQEAIEELEYIVGEWLNRNQSSRHIPAVL